jgi:hypothetical protein
MSFAIKRGWGPALVAGVLAVVVLVPADPVTEILTLILVLVLTVIALLGISRVANLASAPVSRQRLVSWLVAVAVAVVVGVFPLMHSMLRR